MKNLLCVLLMCLLTAIAIAQIPQSFNYQATLLNSNGTVMANTAVVLRFTIHSTSSTGPILYQETHNITTSDQGIVNLLVGTGAIISGTFSSIDWESTLKFFQVEVNSTGTFVDMGTQQLVSVPFAFAAQNVVNGWSTDGNAGTNYATHYIGTSDAQNLAFRVNNQTAGRVEMTLHPNTALGCLTLVNSTGGSNLACGYGAMKDNTGGYENSACGMYALMENTTGAYNVAMGTRAGGKNTIGRGNVMLGSHALFYNSTGYYNCAIGYHAMYNSLDIEGDVAIGAHALTDNVNGKMNVAVGYRALESQYFSNGGTEWNSENTAIGYKSLSDNAPTTATNGYRNTAVGSYSLLYNTAGSNNSVLGRAAMFYNLTGYENAAVGVNALFQNTYGYYNAAVGAFALNSNTYGTRNSALGNDALYYVTTGTQNTGVGASAGPNSGTLNNTTAIGRSAVTTASNQVRLGNSSVTSIGGYAAWTNVSDGRFKTNVKENVSGLEFIMLLRPVTYNMEVNKLAEYLGEDTKLDSLGNVKHLDPDSISVSARNEKEKIVYTGFIAQEVEQAAKASGYEFSGIDVPANNKDLYGLKYAEFTVPLVKAVQEQQILIDNLQKENEIIKLQYAAMLDLQNSLLEKLKVLEQSR